MKKMPAKRGAKSGGKKIAKKVKTMDSIEDRHSGEETEASTSKPNIRKSSKKQEISPSTEAPRSRSSNLPSIRSEKPLDDDVDEDDHSIMSRLKAVEDSVKKAHISIDTLFSEFNDFLSRSNGKVELVAGSNLYVNKERMEMVREVKSATSFARQLLTAVFSVEELYNANLRGGSDKRSNESTKKKALDVNKLEILITACQTHCESTFDRSKVLSAIQQRLLKVNNSLKSIVAGHPISNSVLPEVEKCGFEGIDDFVALHSSPPSETL